MHHSSKLALAAAMLVLSAVVHADRPAATPKKSVTPPVSVRHAPNQQTTPPGKALPSNTPIARQMPAANASVLTGNPDAVRALILPVQQTTLAAQSLGKILKIPTTIGAAFKKGDVLVIFMCDEAKARLQVALAEQKAASETHEAKLRLQGLNAASQLEVALAAAEVEKARGQVALQQAAVKQCQIKAPFSGRIAKLQAQPYETVNQGQALMDIVDTSAFKVKVIVPSRWLRWLHKGTLFHVHIDENGHTYTARVSSINSRIEPVSETIDIEGTIEGKHDGLLPGMSGNARFDPKK